MKRTPVKSNRNESKSLPKTNYSKRYEDLKPIVVYCDYGYLSGVAAQMLAERGFDNVFLLHGGLAQFAEEFPSLVGPNAPPKPLRSPSKRPAATHSAAPGRKTPVAAPRSPSRAARAVAARPGERKPWK